MTQNKLPPNSDLAAAALIKFLNELDTVHTHQGKPMIPEILTEEDMDRSSTIRGFIGYPIWCRTVYVSTLPISSLLKTIQSFSIQPEPVVSATIMRAQRDLLEDSTFVIFVQSLRGPAGRIEWLQDKCRVSSAGRTFVDYCGHLMIERNS